MRKGFNADRLSLGEWLDLLGSLLLAAALVIGWHGVSIVFSVLAAIGCVLGVLVWLTCASRRSPSLPLTLAVAQTPFSWLAVVWLLIESLGGAPGTGIKLLGLCGALLSSIGIYRSFRRESSPPADTPASIETLSVDRLPLGPERQARR